MMEWPRGTFAFTVFDDTDFSTVENTKPIYDFLYECGFRTTKSCWVRQPDPGEQGKCPGSTLAEDEYRQWILDLRDRGFEIGLHNASFASSTRQQTKEALESFTRIVGYPPRSFANHAGTRDSVYWGPARLSGVSRLVYNILTRFRNKKLFVGHKKGTPFYWGDLLKEYVTYVRNFTYTEINTIAVCPEMPYENPETPEANMWFASCDGHDLSTFCKALSEERQDQLESEGGCCIMYTHFGSGFVHGGAIDPEFKRLMKRLASKGGYFVPVGPLLDSILEQRGGDNSISRRRRCALSRKWICQKIRMGGTS